MEFLSEADAGQGMENGVRLHPITQEMGSKGKKNTQLTQTLSQECDLLKDSFFQGEKKIEELVQMLKTSNSKIKRFHELEIMCPGETLVAARDERV